jgi:hypothetical protein
MQLLDKNLTSLEVLPTDTLNTMTRDVDELASHFKDSTKSDLSELWLKKWVQGGVRRHSIRIGMY